MFNHIEDHHCSFIILTDLNFEFKFSYAENICAPIIYHLANQYMIIQSARSSSSNSSSQMRGALCRQTVGISQGSVIAPLLCAIHFAAMDNLSEDKKDILLRWVDDFLFISWKQDHTMRFTDSLIYQRIWGDNINWMKLNSNDEEVRRKIQEETDQLNKSSIEELEWASLRFGWGNERINIKTTTGKKAKWSSSRDALTLYSKKIGICSLLEVRSILIFI